MKSLRRGIWVLVVAQGMLLQGCGSSSLAPRQEHLASRESLNTEELDALTAAGEGSALVGSVPSGQEGFHVRGPTLQDASGSLPAGQLPMLGRQPTVVPTILQSNGIRQSR